jgi:hypothetical protein
MQGGVQGRQLARRRSLNVRVEKSAEIIRSHAGKWVVWCGLNDEGRSLAAELGDAAVLVEGSHDSETKLERERRWREGDAQVLITKPSIFGFGMNWQHCHQVLFLGLGDSWEQYYQAIRRCWRFGQTDPVDVYVVTSTAEQKVVDNIWRKEAEAERTASEVIARMADWEKEAIGCVAPHKDEYERAEESGDGWRMLLGDSSERINELEPESVGLSVHSPPFAQLYTYSASLRDLGNCRIMGNSLSTTAM